MLKPINFDLVADLYDIYVNVSADIPFFLKETEGFSDTILELMCGTGRVSVPLLQAGRKLLCVDYSGRMLDELKAKLWEENNTPEIIKADITLMDLQKKFGLILLPFHSLTEILETEKQQQALINIDKHLEQGGTFICTLQNPKVRLQSADGVERTLGEYSLGANNKLIISYTNTWDPASGLVHGYQYYEILDDKNNFMGKRILEINFRPITDETFRSYIKNTGMTIANVWGDYSYSPFDEETSNFIIYKLKKEQKN